MAAPSGRALRRRRGLTAFIALLVLLCASACGGASSDETGPDQQVAQFVAAWQQDDPDAAAELTTDPAAASALISDVTRNVRPESVAVTVGAINRIGQDNATVDVTYAWTIPDAGTWTYPASWSWRRLADGWRLVWAPTAVHPELGERQTMSTQRSDAEPGVMVDRNNVQLVAPVRVYSVVLMPRVVPDLPATAAQLAAILAPLNVGITAESILAGAAQATASAPPSGSAQASDGAAPSDAPPSAAAGTGLYTVVNVREPDFIPLRDQLQNIPGVTVNSEVRNLAPTPDFARSVLTQLTPAVADRLDGTDGWKVVLVDSTGGVLEALHDEPAVPGERVALTLDTAMQTAAEETLAGIPQPAVLLTMQPSTGEIMTVAQNAPANAQGTPALTGQYPPGSTFKVVTATAALERDLMAPGRPIACPASTAIDGRLIRNSHDFGLGTVDSTLAFARSCNTTFANLAAQMPADALTDAAQSYGIGLDFVMEGVITLTGKVPPADSTVQRAENGFGQGQVLISPFSGLLMAATAANGTMPMPVLIRGSATTVDNPAPPRPPQAQQGVQTYMRAVVDEGTGVQLEGFGDVHAKTGTAEFVAADGSVHAHAWTVGYRGDLAFAALIVGGEDSVHTNQLMQAFFDKVG